MLLGTRGCPENIAAILSGILVENHDAVNSDYEYDIQLRRYRKPALKQNCSLRLHRGDGLKLVTFNEINFLFTSMKLLYCKVNSKKTPQG